MLTLWKTQILHHLDYCSQLWSPSKTGDIQSLELLQKYFLTRIRGMYSLCYWDQLSRLQMYSLERRRERYQIIYTWRIIEKQVPNLEITPIQSYKVQRHGRLCRIPVVPSNTRKAVQTIRYSTLSHVGPRLFNSLPKYLRDASGCSVDVFKGMLDRLLAARPASHPRPHRPQAHRYKLHL